MKKNILMFLIFILLLIMVACSGGNEKNYPIEELDGRGVEEVEKSKSELLEEGFVLDEVVIFEEIDEVLISKYSKTEQIAVDFVMSISNEDYESFKALVGLNDAPLLEDKDIRSYLVQMGWEPLLGTSFKITDVVIEEEGLVRNFLIDYNIEGVNKTFYGDLIFNNESWYVRLEDFVLLDWQLETYLSYNLTVDGIDLSAYRDGKTYHIPNVPYAIKTVKTTIMDDEREEDMMPTSGENIIQNVIVTGDYRSEAIDWYVKAINEMMAFASRGDDVSHIIKYFDLNIFTLEGINIIYEKAKEEHKGKNVAISSYEIYEKTNKEVLYPVYVGNSGDVRITYRLNYVWGDDRMSLISQVTLVKTKDGFVISEWHKDGNVITRLNKYSNE